MSPMKYFVILGFSAVLIALAAALFFMMRTGQEDDSKGKKMATALALRIGLSIVLFVCILIAWKLGYIQPTGLPTTR